VPRQRTPFSYENSLLLPFQPVTLPLCLIYDSRLSFLYNSWEFSLCAIRCLPVILSYAVGRLFPVSHSPTCKFLQEAVHSSRIYPDVEACLRGPVLLAEAYGVLALFRLVAKHGVAIVYSEACPGSKSTRRIRCIAVFGVHEAYRPVTLPLLICSTISFLFADHFFWPRPRRHRIHCCGGPRWQPKSKPEFNAFAWALASFPPHPHWLTNQPDDFAPLRAHYARPQVIHVRV
jgi:hypothetical protein